MLTHHDSGWQGQKKSVAILVFYYLILSFILLLPSFLSLLRMSFSYFLVFIQLIPDDLFCGLYTINVGARTTRLWIFNLPHQAPTSSSGNKA